LAFSFQAAAFEIDLETSLQYKNSDFKDNDYSLEKAALGLKKIISDKKGDRLQFFLKLEAEENFEETGIAQLYVKYKGPMGRWNITLGRSLVPFGLITDYDSEMLILKTQEKFTIGHKVADGIKLSGFWKSIDYELLFGAVELESSDLGNIDKMLALKTSYKGYDPEDINFGLSLLTSEFSEKRKNLLGVDITKFHGLLISRNEFVFGKITDQEMYSIFAGLDYSILPKIDISSAYTYFQTEDAKHTAFLGITYNSTFFGTVFRLGNKYYFKDEKGVDKNEIIIQIYNSFNRYF